jgi:hypothetical protein
MAVQWQWVQQSRVQQWEATANTKTWQRSSGWLKHSASLLHSLLTELMMAGYRRRWHLPGTLTNTTSCACSMAGTPSMCLPCCQTFLLPNSVLNQMLLDAQSDLCGKRLGRAGKLTSLLGDELVRWGTAADELAGRLELLVGDAFMAAAVVNYLGAFPGEWCTCCAAA